MPLTLKRKQNQTWFEAGLAQAQSYGLAEEFLTAYHHYIKLGATEEDAVWFACYDWDVLDSEGDNQK